MSEDSDVEMPVVGDSVDHPLAQHEFLDDDSNMFAMRAKRREEMEKIEANPQKYIENIKIDNAREQAAKLLSSLKKRGDEENMDVEGDVAEDVVEEVNSTCRVPEDDEVKVVSNADFEELDDDNCETVCVDRNTIINISNVKKLVIKIGRN